MIPELGRSKRDVLVEQIPTIRALAGADVESFLTGRKTVFPGIGPDTLRRFQARAKLIEANGAPHLRDATSLPDEELEVFFDVEVDPWRDRCYLHGFFERRRRGESSERYVAFFVEEPTEEAERQAFSDAWMYLQSCQPCGLYF